MDPVELAILLLRLALVGLVYAFLFVVVRGAVGALRSAPEHSGSTARGGWLWLRVVEPGASGLAPDAVLEVFDGETLGRARRANVVLPDATVSAEHARLARQAGAWVVTDLGSTNGTLVNDVLARGAMALRPGDILGLGGVRLEVLGEPDQPPTTGGCVILSADKSRSPRGG